MKDLVNLLLIKVTNLTLIKNLIFISSSNKTDREFLNGLSERNVVCIKCPLLMCPSYKICQRKNTEDYISLSSMYFIPSLDLIIGNNVLSGQYLMGDTIVSYICTMEREFSLYLTFGKRTPYVSYMWKESSLIYLTFGKGIL